MSPCIIGSCVPPGREFLQQVLHAGLHSNASYTGHTPPHSHTLALSFSKVGMMVHFSLYLYLCGRDNSSATLDGKMLLQSAVKIEGTCSLGVISSQGEEESEGDVLFHRGQTTKLRGEKENTSRKVARSASLLIIHQKGRREWGSNI